MARNLINYLEYSDRPGFYLIGGRRWGRAVRRAYDWCPSHPPEWRSPSAVALACAVSAICSLVTHLHSARRPFDNRFNNSVPKYADAFDRNLNRASTFAT